MNCRTWLLATTLLASTALAEDVDAGVTEAPPAAAPVAAPAPAPAAAPAPAPAPAPAAPAPGLTFPLVGKFSASIYGFAEFDGMYDSTEGLNDLYGNSLIARPDKYAGQHGRTTFSVRNSRIGFKLNAPEWNSIKASATLEMDFLGSQPTTISDAATFVNPTFRIRHAYVKMETPVLDVLIGQTWQLLGWQSYFFPAAVELQGNLGQLYSRSPQIRLSKTLKSDAVNFDVALAASRPGQRDSAVPDGQGGLKLTLNNWKTVRTVSATSTSVDGAAIGVSGLVRRFDLPEFSASPKKDVKAIGWGYSVDAFLPLVRATADDRANALSLTASFARGAGAADFYTSLSGGVSNASLPNPSGATPAPTYTPNIDGGLVAYDKFGNLFAIDWSTFITGIQYYLPPNGSLWVAVDYAHIASNNSAGHGAASAVLNRANWVSASLFWDVTRAVRLAASWSLSQQYYVDNVKAENQRFQLSAFFIF